MDISKAKLSDYTERRFYVMETKHLRHPTTVNEIETKLYVNNETRLQYFHQQQKEREKTEIIKSPNFVKQNPPSPVLM